MLHVLLAIVGVTFAFLAFAWLTVTGHPITRLFRVALFDLDDGDQPRSVAVRQRLEEAAERYRDLKAKPERDRGDTYAADLQLARNDVIDLDHEWDRAVKDERYDFERAAWEKAVEDAAKGPQARGGQATNDDVRGDAARTFGTDVVLQEGYAEWARSKSGGRMPELEIEGRSMLSPHLRALVDSSTDNSGSDAGLLIPAGQPIPPTPRQMRFWLRDVLSVQTTTLPSIPYIRELDPTSLELGASSVSEGAPKPEVALDFERDNAVAEKIAAWLPATMEILQDAPTLRGYIDTRLIYMLKVRETQQILKGSGVSPQIKGILTFTTQTQSAVAGDVPATVAAAIGKVENVDGDANGIAMNPLDYWGQVATRHATQFDGSSSGNSRAPFGATPGTLWDEPVIRTRALAQTECVVGDWAMGATLFDRMQNVIRQSDSHDDFFVNNKVAILAEERVALAVFRPDFFVNVTLDLTA